VPLRPAGSPPATTRVVVRFAPTVPLDEQERRVRAAGGRRLIPARFAGFSRVPVPRGADPEAVAARLRREDGVVWAEPDRPCRSFARSVHAAATFDDPLLPLQWHHTRIRLLETFDRNAPRGRNVIVAIVDTGVAFGDGGSFPSRRGVDLDGAAFVPGFDFVDDDPLAYDEGSALDPDDPDSQRFGHGTFAASQIVAVAGNGTGGIGIAPNVTIMPLRVLGLDGFGFFSDVAEAVDFAVAGGASVISLSLGGEEASTPLDEAIGRATGRGVLIVASAGNEATDPEPPADVSFPARHPEVLAVGATDFFGNRAAYSNRGTGLDLMAPAGGNNELVDGNVRDGTLAASFVVQADGSNPSYGHFFATGTSFAAPQVAGVAALLASLGVRDGAGLRILLLETVTDRGARGFDTDFGLGELDALRAHLGVGFN
jgi:serine protease